MVAESGARRGDGEVQDGCLVEFHGTACGASGWC